MKTYAKLTVAFILFLGLSFGVYHGTKLYELKREVKHRRPAKTVRYEKPIVVVIPSYNNSRYCEWNLWSVLSQQYNNYRVIYINDASTDDTLEKVKAFLDKQKSNVPFTLIHNETNRGALANLYNAIHSCKDEEIVITVDGDDALAHPYVLEKINKVYNNDDIWMTYGNYLEYPAYAQNPVICKPIPLHVLYTNRHRKAEWVSSHLRTFYAGLFKKIKLQDLLYKGKFFPMTGDIAHMIPLLEMAGKHAHYIKDTLYLYNRENPINDHKKSLKLQSACYGHIKSLARYSRLPELKFEPSESSKQADLVAFSYDRPLQLYALLESFERYTTHVANTSVIYKSSSEQYDKGYEQVKARFPYVHFYRETEEKDEDFRSLFQRVAFSKSTSNASYISFAVDDIILTGHIDFRECIQKMEQTKAYGFYLSLGENINHSFMRNQDQDVPPHVALDGDVQAWQFGQGRIDWNYPHSVDMVLYRKGDIENTLTKIPYHNPPTLESNWAQKSKKKRLGLFYTRSKCVNIPLNIVSPSTNRHANTWQPPQLLEVFNQGKKLDITPLFQIENNSRHMDYRPTFTSQTQ